jgi:hypothetical protein
MILCIVTSLSIALLVNNVFRISLTLCFYEHLFAGLGSIVTILIYLIVISTLPGMVYDKLHAWSTSTATRWFDARRYQPAYRNNLGYCRTNGSEQPQETTSELNESGNPRFEISVGFSNWTNATRWARRTVVSLANHMLAKQRSNG